VHDLSTPEQKRRDLVIVSAGLALLALWDPSGLDLWIAWAFGSAEDVPLQDAFVPSVLLHEGGRCISDPLFAWGPVSAARPLPSSIALLMEQRRFRRGITVVCLLLTPTPKHFSQTSCP
jgi:hypothetical protein